MIKIVRKYQKALMAIFAVGLMIIFVANIGGNPGGGGFRDPVLGKIYDGDEVRYQELTNARRAWDKLKRTLLVNMSPGGEPMPAVARLSLNSLTYWRSGGQVIIPAQMIDRDADVFYALIQEAEHLGLTASEDDIQELIRNVDPRMAPQNRDEVEDLRYAFGALLKVEAAYQRASSVLKVSEPQRENDFARLGQELKVHFVEFSADEFKAAVPAPTPLQLSQQFEAFANFNRDQVVEETNPFGFGYRYPNRVKVEFITVLQEQLKDVVRKSRDDATWEIEARKVYLRNKDRYPASRPSEDKKLSPYVAAPTTGPTTRRLGFEDYKKEILDTLIETEAAKLGESVRKRITVTMEQDYNAYRTAVGPATTQPSTQPSTQPAGPATALGVPYGSDQYLQALAQVVQAEFKLLPVVMTINKDWQTQNDLKGLPSIGEASLPGRSYYAPGVGFPEFATTYVDAFGHTPGPRDQAPTLSVMQPSPPLGDDDGNLHLFRLTGADPAHPAKEMAPFAEQVEKDYRTAEAIKLARKEADKLLEPAKKAGLDAAAKSIGRKYMTSGAITGNGVASSQDLRLSFDSQSQLFKAGFDLLQDPEAVKNNRTAGVVELPRDGKVLVITLAELKPTQPGRPRYQIAGSYSRQMSLQIEDRFMADWFSPENVIKRTHFELESRKQPKTEPE